MNRLELNIPAVLGSCGGAGGIRTRECSAIDKLPYYSDSCKKQVTGADLAHAQMTLDQSGSAQKAGNWYEAYSDAPSALMLAQKAFTVVNSSTTSSTKEISQPQGVNMVPKLSAAIVTALLLAVLVIIIQDKKAKNPRDISYWQSGPRHGELRPDYS